jgi:hypothetical protein
VTGGDDRIATDKEAGAVVLAPILHGEAHPSQPSVGGFGGVGDLFPVIRFDNSLGGGVGARGGFRVRVTRAFYEVFGFYCYWVSRAFAVHDLKSDRGERAIIEVSCSGDSSRRHGDGEEQECA